MIFHSRKFSDCGLEDLRLEDAKCTQKEIYDTNTYNRMAFGLLQLTFGIEIERRVNYFYSFLLRPCRFNKPHMLKLKNMLLVDDVITDPLIGD